MLRERGGGGASYTERKTDGKQESIISRARNIVEGDMKPKIWDLTERANETERAFSCLFVD